MHYLKCEQPYFSDVVSGNKNFEVRINDRDFKEGDVIILQEISKYGGAFTGSTQRVVITYVLQGGRFGIAHNYCVMGIKLF